MNKRELIDAITAVNPSATREFLLEFSERELSDYMRQLDSLGLTRSDFHGSGVSDAQPNTGEPESMGRPDVIVC